MQTTTILYVGQDTAFEKTLSGVVDGIGGCRLETAQEIGHAPSRLQRGDICMIIAHLTDPTRPHELAEFLRTHAKRPARSPVVVLSDSDDPAIRLSFMELKALDCLTRPIDLTHLSLLIDLATAARRYGQPAVAASESSNQRITHIDGLICASPAMEELVEQARSVAPLDTTLLLTGDTGTGKTYLARLIHRWSPRHDKPMVVVQCGALAPTLLESALFGHVRGAFTGADRDQIGRLAEARDGTILLDDVDCMPLESQTRLLTAVEDRVFERVGSARPEPLRARLIFATNRRLEAEVAAGRFRADLYYRLDVMTLGLPRLSAQPAAIFPLAEQFLATFREQHNRPVEGFTERARAALLAYDWPGNVRELRNSIERAVVLCRDGVIDVHDLTAPIQESFTLGARPAPGPFVEGNQLAEAKERAEVDRLAKALQHNKNNRTHTAAELGVSRMTLFRRMRHYGLT